MTKIPAPAAAPAIERIIIQIDNDPSSVGQGWSTPAREILEDFRAFVETAVAEMYPDVDVTVVLAGRTTVDGPGIAITESVSAVIPYLWREFAETLD